MPSHWKILACDLDGTLIGWDRKINERDLESLRQCQGAGIHVAICTGRNSLESQRVTRALGLTGLGVFVNGAMVCDMATAAAADSQFIPDDIVQDCIDFFAARGHAILVLVDDPASRLPTYFLTDHGPAHRATTDWLLVNKVASTGISDLPTSTHGRIVRLGVVTDVQDAEPLHTDLRRHFHATATTHSIYSPAYNCQIIEFFKHGVDKWSGIQHMARVMSVPETSIIAIGDDTNDIAMLRGASLSFAMGDAKPHVQAHAKRLTAPQTDCGLSMVIDQLLAGQLEP
jgi:hypothetical protein